MIEIVAFIIIFILQLLTPFWWWIMVVPFLCCFFMARSGWHGFRVGMFSAGGVWLVVSLYLYFTGSGIIAGRVAEMFNLGLSWFAILLAVFLAALAGGISGLAGFSLKALLTGAPARVFAIIP
ncbi:MAG: hypothetical protein ACE5LC_06355 [Candidatus Aminicenantales bacterium]